MDDGTAVATVTRVAGWWRLGCAAAALAIGTHAYRLHLRMPEDWWRWTVELVAGAALVTLALGGGPQNVEPGPRRWLRRAVGVLASILIVLAVRYGGAPGHELAAGVLTTAALASFFIFRWTPFSAADLACLDGGGTRVATAGDSAGRVLLGLAVVVAVAAAAINRSHHALGFSLWLVSLILLPLAMRRLEPRVDQNGFCGWRLDGGPQLSPSAERSAVVVVFLLAVALRLPLLDQFPAFINSDEARLGRYAETLWKQGIPNAFGLGWNAFPNLSLLAGFLPVQLLGMDITSMRVGSVVVGLGSLLATYFWVRRWWGNVIAVLAMLLLTFNHEHVNWSRVGLNNIQQVLVGALMLAGFARALQTRRPVDWVWFGFAAGLSFHVYHAAKLFPALLFATGLLYAIGARGFLRRNLSGAFVAIIAFLFMLGPHLVTIYVDWQTFIHNTSNRVDLAVLVEAYQRGDVEGVRNYVMSHVLATLYLFTVNEWAFLDPFLCVPAILGIGWMLWRWRDPRHLAVVAWIGGILLIGGMITAYPPNVPRLIGVLPATCLIPAVVAGRLRSLLHAAFPRRADTIAVPLLILWLAASAYHNWRTEFVLRPRVQRGDAMTGMCRIIARTPLPATNYTLASIGEIDARVAPIDCMMPLDVDRTAISPADDPSVFPVPPDSRGTVVYFFTRLQAELVEAALHYYPESKYETVNNSEGRPHLWAVTITPEEIDRKRGLRAVFRSGLQVHSPVFGVNPLRCEECTDFPVEATAEGLVFVPQPAAYQFQAPGGVVTVNGREIAAGETVELHAGWHELTASATLADSRHSVAVQWKPQGAQEWVDVPRDHLHTHPAVHGLLGRYYSRLLPLDSPTPSAEPPDFAKLDLAISFDWSPEFDRAPPPAFAAKPSTMEWVGMVHLREGQAQRLRLETTAATRVFLAGKQVLASPGGYPATGVEVLLTGLHGRLPILVRSVRPVGDPTYLWWLRLLWGQPGGGWTTFADYKPPR